MTYKDDINDALKGKGETILIIDDETSFVEVTKILLQLSGYTIITAKNGIEGIHQFKSNIDAIKVVICDLNMPKMGGKSAVQTLLELNPAIKILIISGSIQEEDIPNYLEPGKIGYLQKPFLTETLLETLKKMLQYHELLIGQR